MLLANDVLDHAKRSTPFKIHLITVSVLCVAAFGVWAFISVFVAQWPWFIYVFCVGILSIALHYYIGLQRPRQYFQVHLITYGVVNTCVFLTWFLLNNISPYTWFLYSLFGLAIPLGIHAVFDKYPDSPCLSYNATTFLACFITLVSAHGQQ